MATYDNHITRECVEAVIPFAKGGSAVVAMGSGFINKELPAACHHVPGMSDPHIVVTLSQWVEAARRWGAKAEIELVPVASYFGTHEVESSVGIPMDIDINILTHEEIKQFIQDYAVSARNAMKAGADIVNVHGAHGQLPALLFNPVFNKRTDEYGAQSFENRCRFAVELLDAIRAECGNNIAIEYRLSATDIIEGSPEVEEVIEFAKAIQDKIDMLLISRGCLAINKLMPLILPATYIEHGINIEYSSKALLFISRQWRRIFFARSTGLPFHRFQPHLVGKGFFAWQYLRPLKIAFDHKNGSGVTVKVYDLATKRIKTGKLTGPFSSVTRNQLVSDILLWPDGSRGDNSSFLDTLHKLYHILVISDLKRMAGEIVDQLKGNIPDFTEFGIVPKLLRCEQFIERR